MSAPQVASGAASARDDELDVRDLSSAHLAQLDRLGLTPRAEFLGGAPRDFTEREQDDWHEQMQGQFVDTRGQVLRTDELRELLSTGGDPGSDSWARSVRLLHPELPTSSDRAPLTEGRRTR